MEGMCECRSTYRHAREFSDDQWGTRQHSEPRGARRDASLTCLYPALGWGLLTHLAFVTRGAEDAPLRPRVGPADGPPVGTVRASLQAEMAGLHLWFYHF